MSDGSAWMWPGSAHVDPAGHVPSCARAVWPPGGAARLLVPARALRRDRCAAGAVVRHAAEQSPAFSGWVAYAPLSRTVSWSSAQVVYSSSFSVLLQSDTGLTGIAEGWYWAAALTAGFLVTAVWYHRTSRTGTWLGVPGQRLAADRGGHRGPAADGGGGLAAQVALAVQRVVPRYVRPPGHRPRPAGTGPPRSQPPAGHRRAGLYRGSPRRGLAGLAQRPVSAHRQRRRSTADAGRDRPAANAALGSSASARAGAAGGGGFVLRATVPAPWSKPVRRPARPARVLVPVAAVRRAGRALAALVGPGVTEVGDLVRHADQGDLSHGDAGDVLRRRLCLRALPVPAGLVLGWVCCCLAC